VKFDLNCETSVVATVTQEADLVFLEDASTTANQLGFDVLEFRLDNLNQQSETRIIELQNKWRSSHKILSTARHPSEGGHGDLSEAQRIAWLVACLPSSDLVDIEIQSLTSSGLRQVAAQAQQESVQVVASHHNFEIYPERQLLADQIAQAFELGADVAKLAVVVKTHRQLSELVELVEATRSDGRLISAMGMGPLGKLSRLVLASAGSCLNYGYLNEPNAPGQWPAVELKCLVEACSI